MLMLLLETYNLIKKKKVRSFSKNYYILLSFGPAIRKKWKTNLHIIEPE